MAVISIKHWFLDFIGSFREPTLKDLSSETILITGAASGLGKGLAQRLARFGCTLILWDVDGAANARVAEELNQATKTKRIHAMRCDLTSRENIYECAVDVCILNSWIEKKNRKLFRYKKKLVM
jgi:all-trans-retinol dehydrogenase (NAD+)